MHVLRNSKFPFTKWWKRNNATIQGTRSARQLRSHLKTNISLKSDSNRAAAARTVADNDVTTDAAAAAAAYSAFSCQTEKCYGSVAQYLVGQTEVLLLVFFLLFKT